MTRAKAIDTLYGQYETRPRDVRHRRNHHDDIYGMRTPRRYANRGYDSSRSRSGSRERNLMRPRNYRQQDRLGRTRGGPNNRSKRFCYG